MRLQSNGLPLKVHRRVELPQQYVPFHVGCPLLSLGEVELAFYLMTSAID